MLADLADWCVYDDKEQWGIEDEPLSRVRCAYHSYFAIPPYDMGSWRVPSEKRRTDKPRLPQYFTVPLRPDLRMALARFRLSAHNLRVVRGRYAGEDYYARVCGLVDDENCPVVVQDEMHMIFECQHNALCVLREQYEELFVAPAHGSTPAQSLFLFMNQRDVISVAKFVQQLQSLMDTLLRAPTDDSTT